MSVIHLKELLMPEAERCVAEIWTCLEQYHIPSPAISFEFCNPLGARVTLMIDDPVAANTLRVRLTDWIEEENDRFVRKRSPTYTQAIGHEREAAPIGFVLALADPTRPTSTVSRPRRK